MFEIATNLFSKKTSINKTSNEGILFSEEYAETWFFPVAQGIPGAYKSIGLYFLGFSDMLIQIVFVFYFFKKCKKLIFLVT